MSKNLSAKYYKKKKTREKHQNLSKEEKENK